MRNRTVETFTALMWYLGADTLDTFKKKNHGEFYLEGRNFRRLVKNRTIEKLTALMWYLAGSNFGRFVRNRSIEICCLQRTKNTCNHKRYTRVGLHVRTLGNQAETSDVL